MSYEHYFSFCKAFDRAYNKQIAVDELEALAKRLNIDFDDFCEANDLINANTWPEALQEYGAQIESGFRE